jgi:hypothetical protein
VRRMHLAGDSLPEIADALGLSYERAHQIAEGADGTWPSPLVRSRATCWHVRSAART